MNYSEIAQSIYVVNKHAKAATDPKYLYSLKNASIQKLLKEGAAEKIGLHFSPNPKLCRQRVDTVIKMENYFFHIPPSKNDREILPHLGERDQDYRNPKSSFSLKKAKETLEKYTNLKKTEQKKKNNPIFRSSYLDKK